MAAIRLGIDIGGTKTALALGDDEDRILARSRRATEPCGDPRRDLERLAGDARDFVIQNQRSLEELACVGVSLPGPLDRESGRVFHPANLPGWGDVAVAEILESLLAVPVQIENDANMAAMAESRFGAGRGFNHLVYLTMSTGIGGGLVTNGELYAGHRHAAGEIGHAPVAWPGDPCSCGLSGCLEAYVGGAAWQRRLRSIAPPDGEVVRRAGGRERVTPEHAVAAAHEGDPFALAELDRLTDYLARALVALQFTLAPEVIVLGTIAVAAGEELFLAPLVEKVRSQCWPPPGEIPALRLATLGEDLAYRAGLCAVA